MVSISNKFCAVLAATTLLGCMPKQHKDRFYTMGMEEGRKHAKERPETSLIVFPKEASTWSKEAREHYHSGYVDGLAQP